MRSNATRLNLDGIAKSFRMHLRGGVDLAVVVGLRADRVRVTAEAGHFPVAAGIWREGRRVA